MSKCAICGKGLATFGINKVRLKGGDKACFDCVRKAGHDPFTWMGNNSTTVEQLIKEIKERERRINEARSINTGVAAANPIPSQDPADEIMKYKKLLDAGAITEEEFTAKKKQLLGL